MPPAARWNMKLSKAVELFLQEVRVHRFRHTYGTRLLEAGVDVRLVKELMGHEDIKSTVVDTEVTDAALSAAVLRVPWNL